MEKKLSPEEQELFFIADQQPMIYWHILSKYLRDKMAKYTEDIRLICEKYHVHFVDLNQNDSLKNQKWLFIDRVHLTDLGYEYLADIISHKLKTQSPPCHSSKQNRSNEAKMP